MGADLLYESSDDRDCWELGPAIGTGVEGEFLLQV